jgi:hypothetical protein
MKVKLNVTAHDIAKGPDEVIDLPGIRATNRVSDTDAVHTDLVDNLVDSENVDEIGTEGVFCGETNLETFGLDEVDDFKSRLGDVRHVLTVRVFAEEGRSAHEDVNAVDSWNSN